MMLLFLNIGKETLEARRCARCNSEEFREVLNAGVSETLALGEDNWKRTALPLAVCVQCGSIYALQ